MPFTRRNFTVEARPPFFVASDRRTSMYFGDINTSLMHRLLSTQHPTTHDGRIEAPLARVSDGGHLPRSIHGFRIYFRQNPGAPRFAGSPGHSKPAPAPPAHGNRHGTNRNQHYLFALG